jgi:hypothetical protein
MSAARSGDWLDEKVAEATGIDKALCTSYKETKLNLAEPDIENDVAMAYDAYHDQLFKYIITLFGNKFQEIKSQFDAPLDIVIAGGTSMPKGFVEKFKKVVLGMKVPCIQEMRPRSWRIIDARVVESRAIRGIHSWPFACFFFYFCLSARATECFFHQSHQSLRFGESV